jgi:hypothetical protein
MQIYVYVFHAYEIEHMYDRMIKENKILKLILIQIWICFINLHCINQIDD